MKNNSNKNNLILDSWIDEYSTYAAMETFKVLIKAGRNSDPTTKNLINKYLESYISHMVYNALAEKENDKTMNAVEKYKATADSFLKIKVDIQTCVAAAFEVAVKKFTKKDLEYYCDIKPVPALTTSKLS